MEYGCIAKKLGHSFSREIHRRLGDYSYELRELAEEELPNFLKARDFRGINVTIPYKEKVIPFLDGISPTAERIGAVNTVVNRDGKLFGYNTDFGGMRLLIRELCGSLAGKKVLILGSGGTGKTARAVAESLSAREILTVSREGKNGISYGEAKTRHADAGFIINTTPVGMYPYPDGMPVDPGDFPRLQGIADAVYNPLRTRLVLAAREKGIRAEGGLYMLAAQAVLASALFTGSGVREELAGEVAGSVYREKENLVLIGMPGSGKSTNGKNAAKALGREFVDLDREIVRIAGKPIPEIFREEGEERFRAYETEAVRAFAMRTGLVIATGGGAVLREENRRLLRQNGKLVFLERSLENLIPTLDRPTADSREKMERLYRERLPVYRAAADAVISSDGEKEETLRSLLLTFETVSRER